jgi:hypothetical protein
VLEPAGIPVEVALSGRFEPTDGRYHWGGRIAPRPEASALVRAGSRDASLRLPDGSPAPARLGEIDPWGGVRVTGVGIPPWQPAEQQSTEPRLAEPRSTEPHSAEPRSAEPRLAEPRSTGP